MTTILIIEDHATNLELMQYLLNAYGYKVIGAPDAETGLELIHSFRPELVLCDIQLPGMDGCELIGILKSDPALSRIPVVAISALAMVGDRDRILAAGFDGYISKPIAPEKFIGHVMMHLPGELHSDKVPTPSKDAEYYPQQERGADKLATVLLVDDRPDNIAVLRSILEPSGYSVITAQSGAEAMALMAGVTPEVILSDLHLPGEPVFRFIDDVKAVPRLREIPFLFISSTTRKWNLIDAAQAKGASRFLFRPLPPLTLLKEIENCLLQGSLPRSSDVSR